jgi:hypothetical protein
MIRIDGVLHGVLAQIEALGLDLVEIRQLAPHRRSQGSGDGQQTSQGQPGPG